MGNRVLRGLATRRTARAAVVGGRPPGGRHPGRAELGSKGRACRAEEPRRSSRSADRGRPSGAAATTRDGHRPTRGTRLRRTAERPINPKSIYLRAETAWRRAELASSGLHEARHTFASILIAAGVNVKAVSTYMGHSSIMITLDRYGRLLPGHETEAIERVDAYLAAATTAAQTAARSVWMAWLSRMRRSRKPLRVVRLVEGSNPSLSASEAESRAVARVRPTVGQGTGLPDAAGAHTNRMRRDPMQPGERGGYVRDAVR